MAVKARWLTAFVPVTLVAALLCTGAIAAGRAMPAELLLIEAYSARYNASRLFIVDSGRGIVHDALPATRQSTVGAWSPDGSRLAYVVVFNSVENHLIIADLWGGSAELIPVTPYPQMPVWSPDGDRFAFFNYSMDMIYVWDGSAAHPLTPPMPMPYQLPTWSPDGAQIAFVAFVDGTSELFVVAADAAAPPRALAPSYQDDTAPLWSPNGRLIVFASSRESPLDSTLPLFLYDTDTRQTRRLTRRGFQYHGYTWSPDGSRLAVWEHAIRSAQPPRLVLINPENRASTAIYDASSFRVTPPHWRSDGRIAFAETSAQASELIILGESGDLARSLTLPDFAVRRVIWHPGQH
jgi:Tol biopolymer transport system component